MIRQLREEGSLGIKPAWAFMFSKTWRKVGRGSYEPLPNRDIGYDKKIYGGTFLNSLILLTKSLAPIDFRAALGLMGTCRRNLKYDKETKSVIDTDKKNAKDMKQVK